MPKYLVTRQNRTPGVSFAIEQRVVELPKGIPAPMGAEPVADSTPTSDWAPVSLAPADTNTDGSELGSSTPGGE